MSWSAGQRLGRRPKSWRTACLGGGVGCAWQANGVRDESCDAWAAARCVRRTLILVEGLPVHAAEAFGPSSDGVPHAPCVMRSRSSAEKLQEGGVDPKDQRVLVFRQRVDGL